MRTTSQQRIKWPTPKCPLFRGSTVVRGAWVCEFCLFLFAAASFSSVVGGGTTLTCFLPKPLEFSAEYNESSTVTLKWTVSKVPPNVTCQGSTVFEVRTRLFSSFEDYAGGVRFSRVISFRPAQGNSYTLDISRVPSGSYYIFDIRNEGRADVGSPFMRQTVTSPAFHFGEQGE